MSDVLIASLNTRNQTLEGDKANLNAALQGERKQRKALQVELARMTTEADAFKLDRDGWKVKAEAAPSEKDAEIATLRDSISQHDFRAQFDKAAKAAGVTDIRLDSLYKLSELKPGDTPAKAEDFAGFLTTAKEAHSWAFGETLAASKSTGAAAQNSGSQAGNSAAVSGGRGGSDTSGSQVQYSLADVRKPGWQAKYPALVKALADGSAVCVG